MQNYRDQPKIPVESIFIKNAYQSIRKIPISRIEVLQRVSFFGVGKFLKRLMKHPFISTIF